MARRRCNAPGPAQEVLAPMHAQRNAGPTRSPYTRIGRRLYERKAADGSVAYYTDVLDAGTGRQVRRKLDARTRTDARRAQAALTTSIDRGESAIKTKLTVSDVYTEWVQAHEDRWSPRTRQAYATIFRHHVQPHVGRVKITDLRASHISGLYTKARTKGHSLDVEVQKLLSGLLSFAITRDYIFTSPLLRIAKSEKPKPRRKTEPRVLEPAEITRLLKAASPASQPILQTLALTGMRQSEVLGLAWADVDLQRAVIKVTAQLTRGENPCRVALKTPAARRDIPLVPAIVDVLRRHREAAFANGRARPEDFVFSTASGRPWDQRNASRAFDAAVKAANLEGDKPSTHDLRHSFASYLITEARLDAHRISRLLGHTSVAFTMTTYARLLERATTLDSLRDSMAATTLAETVR